MNYLRRKLGGWWFLGYRTQFILDVIASRKKRKQEQQFLDAVVKEFRTDDSQSDLQTKNKFN